LAWLALAPNCPCCKQLALGSIAIATVVLTARSLLSLQVWLHFCTFVARTFACLRDTGEGRWSGALPDGESWRGLVVVVVVVVIVVVFVVFTCLLRFAWGDATPDSLSCSLSPPAGVVVVCFESILGRFSQGPVRIPVGGHQLVLGCLSLLSGTGSGYATRGEEGPGIGA
jgi:hypothetical protein